MRATISLDRKLTMNLPRKGDYPLEHDVTLVLFIRVIWLFVEFVLTLNIVYVINTIYVQNIDK